MTHDVTVGTLVGMDAIVDLLAQLPADLIAGAAYLADRPAALTVVVLFACAVGASALVNIKSWRSPR